MMSSQSGRPRRNAARHAFYQEVILDDLENEQVKSKTNYSKSRKEGILAVPGPLMRNPLPDKTKYITERYPDLAKYDLLDIADLEHQKRKLNESFQELFNSGIDEHGDVDPIKAKSDKRTPRILLKIAKLDLGIEETADLKPLGENDYPIIRYINETPSFALHTIQPKDMANKPPAKLLGFADEETMSLSKIIYEFLINFQKSKAKRRRSNTAF